MENDLIVHPPPSMLARHEAAHSVMLLHLGYAIGNAGVTITPPSCAVDDQLPWRDDAMFSLAGLVVEPDEFGARSDECLRCCLALINNPHRDLYKGVKPNDEESALKAIKSEMRDATPADLIGEYRTIEKEAKSVLEHPEVWASVESVTKLLEKGGKRSDAEVRALCPWAILRRL